MSPTALGAKLRHQVPEAAIAVAVLLCHGRDRAMFQKDGPQGFVPALQGLARLAEEGFAEGVVHGSTLKNVTPFFRCTS